MERIRSLKWGKTIQHPRTQSSLENSYIFIDAGAPRPVGVRKLEICRVLPGFPRLAGRAPQRLKYQTYFLMNPCSSNLLGPFLLQLCLGDKSRPYDFFSGCACCAA